ncbi:hypothetical protein ACEPPN_009949 [Leptodophora sp. 'Broadleaf-Isolate-01']
MQLELGSTILDLADSAAQPVSAILHLILDSKLGAPTSIGITIGGPAVARSSAKFGKFMEKLSVAMKHGSQMSSEIGEV